jgi:60 kDa SS-A/Ro ribonucleoprotein
MSKFNTKVTTRTTNLAGGKAFKMNAEQELLHAVLTTFLEDKYYESGDERLERIKELVAKCDPEYVAKLAYVSRKEFNLRSVSVALLGELSKVHNGDDLVMRAIKNTVTRVDDMTELVSYLECKLPKQVKRGIRRALYKFSGYQLAKYRGEGKSVKLVDVFNMVHPKPQFASEDQQKAWKDLVEGNLKTTGQTWESVISSAKNEDKKTSWEGLIRENKLGYMALLRNLNNLINSGVSEEVLEVALNKLTNREEVKKSKQLPFRFVTAYDNVSGNRKVTDAISIAMDYAVDNTPELNGKTLIATDCSGSMSGRPMEVASIFGATLAKANTNADLILYDTDVYEFTFSSRMPVIDLAKKVQSEARGGGTNTSLVFAYAEDKKKKYDRIIVISDNESWQDSYHSWYGSGGGTQAQYNQYRKNMGIDPFVYAIDVQGYGTKDLSNPKCIHLTGWSDKLLDFIGVYEKGGSMVEYIKSINLN